MCICACKEKKIYIIPIAKWQGPLIISNPSVSNARVINPNNAPGEVFPYLLLFPIGENIDLHLSQLVAFGGEVEFDDVGDVLRHLNKWLIVGFGCWFGILKGIPGIQTTNPNQQSTIS